MYIQHNIMMISILITCFNCENFIDKAIASVVAQKMPCDWEVLIGDDGSSDKTIEIIKRWEAKFPNNIRVYLSENGRESNVKNGFKAALNRARLLKAAKGDYIAFLDGDDCLIGEDKFLLQYDILEKKSYISGVVHTIKVNDIENNSFYPLTNKSDKEGDVDSKEYWRSMYYHTNTLLFRKECKNLMLRKDISMHLNDNLITFIVLQFGKLYFINKTFAQYNITGDGVWTGEKQIFGCFRNLTLFDLEKRININYLKESKIRHQNDFYLIIKNYKYNPNDVVHSKLLSILPYEQFKTTFLFANQKKFMKDKIKYTFFVLEIYYIRLHYGIKSLITKINKLLFK